MILNLILLFLCFVLLLFFLNKKFIILKDNFQNKYINEKKAICLLTVFPNHIYLDFLEKIKGYQIYIICDDNSKDLKNLQNKYKNINFIQIQEKDCYNNNFYNLNYVVKNNKPSAWDKAIYYFCKLNNDNNKYIWFIEDDVFIPSINTIPNIDNKYLYKNFDLLSSKIGKYDKNKNKKERWYHWRLFDNKPEKLNEYNYHGMMCAIRLSDNFLKKINEYIAKNDKLIFLEIFFPSLCYIYKLKYKEIKELNNIKWKYNWDNENLNLDYLYHPVKDIQKHKIYRNKFNFL